MRMEHYGTIGVAIIPISGMGACRVQIHRVCASGGTQDRHHLHHQEPPRFYIRARLDLHPRARRHGMGGAMAHPLARPTAAGHHLRGGARHGAGAASGDRYLASAIGNARYLSPWQRTQPDVVATDKNLHGQYSDIGQHRNNNNIICKVKNQAVRLYDPPCEGPTLINEYNLEEPAVFMITFRRLFFFAPPWQLSLGSAFFTMVNPQPVFLHI